MALADAHVQSATATFRFAPSAPAAAALARTSTPMCAATFEGTSVAPVRSRREWFRAAGEMLAVCNEAARRRTVAAQPDTRVYDKPLSSDYIHDRLTLDDPVCGLMARDDASGVVNVIVTALDRAIRIPKQILGGAIKLLFYSSVAGIFAIFFP